MLIFAVLSAQDYGILRRSMLFASSRHITQNPAFGRPQIRELTGVFTAKANQVTHPTFLCKQSLMVDLFPAA